MVIDCSKYPREVLFSGTQVWQLREEPFLLEAKEDPPQAQQRDSRTPQAIVQTNQYWNSI